MKAWIFDVDGVLSNPVSRKVDKPEILHEIVKRLKKGDLIGINTGRSMDYIEKEILNPIEKIIIDKNLLNNVIALGEKGAVIAIYDNGIRKVTSDPKTKISDNIKKGVIDIASKFPYSEVMRNDKTKETLTTIEMIPGKNHEEFKRVRNGFVEEIQKMLSEKDTTGQMTIDVFRIATDIQNKSVGKTFATQKFVEMLTDRGFDQNEYYCFGDDTNDYLMYQALVDLGKTAILIFVGEKEKLDGKDLKDVLFTKKKLDEGTLEYLQNS